MNFKIKETGTVSIAYRFRNSAMCLLIVALPQTLGEDWETPGRMLEVMDAISNFTAVWRGLWLNDPTPQVLTKLMINVNYGAQIGEDEKGQAK